MSDLPRTLRVRPLYLLWGLGVLLCLAGLTAVGLAHVSFGHAHVARWHAALYHHHFYSGSHEHFDARPSDDPSDRGSEAPAPEDTDGNAPGRTATVSVVPALFQPVDAYVPPVLLAKSTFAVPSLALPRVVRPILETAPPRGPPVSLTAPGSCREKGIS